MPPSSGWSELCYGCLEGVCLEFIALLGIASLLAGALTIEEGKQDPRPLL